MDVNTGKVYPDLTREEYEALDEEKKKSFVGIVGPKEAVDYISAAVKEKRKISAAVKEKRKQERKVAKKSRQKNRGKK